MTITTIGIIGHGAFGQLLETLIKCFAPEVAVRIHSRRETPDGVRFFSLEETSASDVLVFAVPIASFEEVLKKAVLHTRADTILIDIATVKTHTTALLKEHADDRPFLATHPMWGPESYEKKGKDVNGFRIVVTEQTLPTGVFDALQGFLETLGFVIVRMTSDEHDQRLAETLFLTHFVGQTIARAGFMRTNIDTVSFGFLMEAVETVKNDTALFEDVFRFNPFCKVTLDRLTIAEQEVRTLLERGEA